MTLVMCKGDDVIRAIAVIVAPSGTWRSVGFRILACPAAPEHQGIVFAATADGSSSRIGEYAVVKFSPDDQFAHECKEALQ